jgi:hypothetical protein
MRETFQEFAKRHGGKQVSRRGQEFGILEFLFPDGAAWVQAMGTSPETRCEPPLEPGQLYQAKLTYARVRMEELNKTFVACQMYIKNQAAFHRMGAGPPPPPDVFTDLEKIRADFEQAQADLQKLEAEMPAQAVEQYAQQYRARRQLDRDRAAEAMKRMLEITRR